MNDKQLEQQKIADECDDILLLLSLNRGITTKQAAKKYGKLSNCQMKSRLTKLRSDEKAYYLHQFGTVYWYAGVGEPVTKRDPVEKVKPFKGRPDFAGLPSEVRHFAGYR